MTIIVEYCKKMRKDGSYNKVAFDPEHKIFTGNETRMFEMPNRVFVEAALSRDVDALREKLIEDGYREVV